VLGLVSLFMDISSELIHSLLPLYMISALGLSALSVGLIEGVAESTALLVKVFSGTLSDYFGKRKILAVIGYGLGAVSKPLFALANGVSMVLSARLIDRVGKGIRGAPRDALVADLTPAQIRGAAYGLRQSLDTVGAFSGPLLAVVLMILFSGDFQSVFWVAVIPALMAVLLLTVGVKEPKQHLSDKPLNPVQWRDFSRLNSDYWWVVVIGAVFTLARFSEAFLVLRAQQAGLAATWVPLVMVVMNIVYALSAYPFGKLSDKMSHSKLLSIGLIVLFGADIVLAGSGHWLWVFVGVALWGLHLGITQGLLASMVAHTAPAQLRGTAFGIFNLLSGAAMLLASATAGFLWDRLGASFTFHAGAGFCVLTMLVMAFKFGVKKSFLANE